MQLGDGFLYSKVLQRAGVVTGIAFMLGLAAKAWMDFDISWDSWWYHMPFAARLWGIVPEEKYELDAIAQGYFKGLPLFGEFMQGFFWWLTGHAQATSFFCLSSFVAYAVFLWRRFGVNLGLATVSLLAVPLVMIHSTSSHTDLPANLAIAAVALLGWQWVLGKPLSRLDVGCMAVLLCMAANSRLQAIPAALVLMGLGALVAVARGRHKRVQPRLRVIVGAVLLVLLVLFVPLRNGVVYGSFTYPVVFEEKLSNPGVLPPSALVRNIFSRSWPFSVLELDRPFGTWRVDQLYIKHDMFNRSGGLCGPYVVAQLCFFFLLCRRFSRDLRKRSLLMLLVLMSIAYLSPRPTEMRYYMFWMIWLVSANLMLARSWNDMLPKIIYGTNAAGLLLVATLTHGAYLWPHNLTLERVVPVYSKVFPRDARYRSLPRKLDFKRISDARDGDVFCIVGQHPFTFAYVDYFHPPVSYKVIERRHTNLCPAGTRVLLFMGR